MFTLDDKSLVQANQRVTEASEVRGQKLVKQFTKMIDSIFLYSKVILRINCYRHIFILPS